MHNPTTKTKTLPPHTHQKDKTKQKLSNLNYYITEVTDKFWMKDKNEIMSVRWAYPRKKYVQYSY